jgi:hypothetical protein
MGADQELSEHAGANASGAAISRVGFAADEK